MGRGSRARRFATARRGNHELHPPNFKLAHLRAVEVLLLEPHAADLFEVRGVVGFPRELIGPDIRRVWRLQDVGVDRRRLLVRRDVLIIDQQIDRLVEPHLNERADLPRRAAETRAVKQVLRAGVVEVA